MKIVYGNLIHLAQQRQFDVIVHGCNCFHTMGAGIAKQIKDVFPEAYEADCKTIRGDAGKLGTLSHAVTSNGLIVVNGYTQFNYGYRSKHVDYDAVVSVFREIKNTYQGKRIAYPKIGSGHAQGDWKIIARIIDIALVGEDHTVVLLE